MQYLIIIAVVVLLSCLFSGCRQQGGERSATVNDQAQAEVEAEKLPQLDRLITRDQLQDRLEELAGLGDLSPFVVGAMCYHPAMPPSRTEYVCPECGEKTIYAYDEDMSSGMEEAINANVNESRETLIAAFRDSYNPEEFMKQHKMLLLVDMQLEQCRAMVKEIKGVSITLDESQFCGNCRGEVEEPALGIVVTYAGSDEYHNCKRVCYEDIVLIKEFLDGSISYVGMGGEAHFIGDHIDRLEQLLGVTLEKKE
ncbi:MAG: hypothetical protein KAS23_07645 [Anaerohalosphaera sp.]|nr:hypothetical protein [Anaerohalosphaera sp.]